MTRFFASGINSPLDQCVCVGFRLEELGSVKIWVVLANLVADSDHGISEPQFPSGHDWVELPRENRQIPEVALQGEFLDEDKIKHILSHFFDCRPDEVELVF